MRLMRTVLRWVFALEALVFLGGGLESVWKVLPSQERWHAGRPGIIFKFVVVYLILLGLFAAVTAVRIRRSGPWLYRTGFMASAMNLLLFPFGTAFGVLGIVYFLRKPPADPALGRRHKPLPGDGTGKLSMILFVIAQIVWVWVAYRSLVQWAGYRGIQLLPPGLLDWIVLACAIYFAVFIHESGHALAGKLIGFRLVDFRLGVFTWQHRLGQWRFAFDWSSVLGGHAGMAPCYDGDLRFRAMFFTLGGPLGSACLGVACLAALFTFGTSLPAWLGSFLLLSAAIGCGDFVLNLVPMPYGGSYSDGARLWQLLRRGPWSDYLCAIYYMGLSRTTELRPGEWPTTMVEGAVRFAAGLPEAADILALAFVHFEDRGEVERAGEYLSEAVSRAPEGSKSAETLAVEQAFFEAFYRLDGVEAARCLKRVQPKLESPDYWRAKAAVEAAEGNLPGAEASWRMGWTIVSALPVTGAFEMDRRQYRALGDRLRVLRERYGRAGASTQDHQRAV